MIETLSDRLDILEQIEKDKEIKLEKRRKKIIKKTDKLVAKEFDKALKVLGHRLSVRRDHYNMYSFYFKIDSSSYLYLYISKHEIIENCTWNLTIYNNQLHWGSKAYREFKYLKQRFKTKEISKMLIEFVNIYYKEKEND